MFVKLYRYQIQKNKLKDWKKNNDAAWRIYRKYGAGKFFRFLSRQKNLFTIIEIEFLKTKRQYLDRSKRMDKDEKLKKLFDDFLKIVKNHKYTEEEFETI